MSTKIYLSGECILEANISDNFGDIVKEICSCTALSADEIYLTQNGKIVSDDNAIVENVQAHVCLKIFGGKGGFGSMLRAIGAQIEKTTNREACRDLSGRRLRDINEEKRLKSWLDKQKEREAEAEERKKKRLERLMTVPKHEFKDSQYESARSELTERVSEAVEEGFKKSTVKPAESKSYTKRKINDTPSGPAKKKTALWLGDDISSSSETDSDSSDSNSSDKSQLTKKMSENAPTVQ